MSEPTIQTGTEYHWIMAVRTAAGAGDYNGVITITAPTTRAHVFDTLKQAVAQKVVEKTGRPEFSVTSFTLEPNALIPGGAQ